MLPDANTEEFNCKILTCEKVKLKHQTVDFYYDVKCVLYESKLFKLYLEYNYLDMFQGKMCKKDMKMFFVI